MVYIRRKKNTCLNGSQQWLAIVAAIIWEETGKEKKALMIVPAEHMGGEEEKALVQDFQSNSFVFNGVGRVWKDKKKKGQIVVSYCKI